jgi:hypothetical protein
MVADDPRDQQGAAPRIRGIHMSRDGNCSERSAAGKAQSANDSLSRQVQGLIDGARSQPVIDERRQRDRFPIPYTFRLTPINADGEMMPDDATTVVGKDISLSGVAFSHDHALPTRRAIISIEHAMVGRFAVEAEIVWTRSTPLGLFESGCRLIRTVDGHTVRSK